MMRRGPGDAALRISESIACGEEVVKTRWPVRGVRDLRTPASVSNEHGPAAADTRGSGPMAQPGQQDHAADEHGYAGDGQRHGHEHLLPRRCGEAGASDRCRTAG